MKLKGKLVLITGASSGIGAACAKQLAVMGANLILMARRLDRIDALAASLKSEFLIDVLTLQVNVQDRSAVVNAVASLDKQWRQIDILINNAGLALTSDKFQDADPKNWDVMIDTNIKGLLYVTHAVLPCMLERQVGHIVNIGSIAGHETYPAGNIYAATKHAVRGITKSLRLDLLGTPVRITEVDPGAVHTEFSEVRWNDQQKAEAFYQQFTPLTADDIADSVVYCVTRPAHVTVAEMVVLPVDQASAVFVNRNE